jgi:5'-3' exoribonuclease 1
MLVRKALEKGETLPTEERFDSNCITPGTEFMVKLQEQLKYFVIQKITNDKLWQGPRIFLSGHEVVTFDYAFSNHYQNVVFLLLCT